MMIVLVASGAMATSVVMNAAMLVLARRWFRAGERRMA